MNDDQWEANLFPSQFEPRQNTLRPQTFGFHDFTHPCIRIKIEAAQEFPAVFIHFKEAYVRKPTFDIRPLPDLHSIHFLRESKERAEHAAKCEIWLKVDAGKTELLFEESILCVFDIPRFERISEFNFLKPFEPSQFFSGALTD